MDTFSKDALAPDANQLLQGVQEAVALALRKHKLLGQSVVIGDEQGQPVIIPADQIPEEACAPWPSPKKS